MSDSLIKPSGVSEVVAKMRALPKLIATQILLEAGAAGIEEIEDDLRARTPEQEGNKRGGQFDEPGSLRDSLDSEVELDSAGRGVRAGVGFGKQSFIARLVDQGHQMVTHDGKVVGAVAPDPFIRQTFDGGAPERAIAAFTKVFEQKLPGLKP